MLHSHPKSIKGDKLRTLVRGEFKKNAAVTDKTKVEALKSNAIRALANYLMLESSNKDDRLRDKMAQFSKSEVRGIGNATDDQNRP
jgi:hypothetical protein